MFRPGPGTCTSCGRATIIVVKKQLCKICNEKKKQEAKKALLGGKIEATKALRELTERKFIRRATMGRGAPLKASAKRKGPSGTLEMFLSIWDERPHLCQVTGALLRRFDIRMCSHILPKSIAPKFALMKENVWLVTPEVHHEWEFGNRNLPMFDKKREEFERLKKLYYEQHTK